MRVSIIIPTLNRVDLLPDVLARLDQQTIPPAEVLLSAPDESHVVPYVSQNYLLKSVFGTKGLCAQRNRAMIEALERADIITFFDDDFIPSNDYIENVVAAFRTYPEWVVVMGSLAADGAHGPGFTFSEGLAILRSAEKRRSAEETDYIAKHPGAYGCNMSIRASCIGALRFDERLVLYGWQEDIDFTNQLLRHGEIVQTGKLFGVHLGAKSGRVSGVKFGYSQVCNPVYLMKKGTMPVSFAMELMARNLIANITKSVWSEKYIDRKGRLAGNMLAIYHILRGRVTPEYIMHL